MSRHSFCGTVMRVRRCSGRPKFPLVVTGLIMAACADEAGITPPGPQYQIASGSREFIVTTTEDSFACDPPPGECSLRGAIAAANDGPAGEASTIVLAADETYALTRVGLGGLPLSVSSTIVVDGNDATIDQQAVNGTVFRVEDGADLTLEDITVTGGDARTGGGIYAENAALTLSNSIVTGNNADSDGGGIFAEGGSMTVSHSEVSGNTAGGVGGGILARGSTFTLAYSEVSGNTAERYGGGIYASRAASSVELIHSTVSENAAEHAGGISILAAPTMLTHSTVNGNVARSDGGGILVGNGGRNLTAVNTTLSGNIAEDHGGGLYVVESSATLINSTVTDNAASRGGGMWSISGGITLRNTIVTDQRSGPDCYAGLGEILSLGHNLDSDGSCELTATGDRPTATANLGPLADNGGPTWTHALLEGSDAIDAGDEVVCAAEPVNGFDQRGVDRPQGTACDIGAFEFEPEPLPTGMTAEPALLHLEGGLLGLRLRLLDLTARLVRADTGAPIEGETITMTVGRQRGGPQDVCSAVTDANGIATCSGGLPSLLGLVLNGYTAAFTGSDEYESSSASAPLIRIDVGGLGLRARLD